MLKPLHERGTRLVQLQGMLTARTGADGKPIPGYEKNVEMLREQIARLEKVDLTTIREQSDDQPAVASESPMR